MDSLGWAGLEPAQGWNENSSLGLSIPFTKLGQASAHPNEAMNSIKRMKLTGAAFWFRATLSPCSGPGSLSLSFGEWSRKFVVSQGDFCRLAIWGFEFPFSNKVSP